MKYYHKKDLVRIFVPKNTDILMAEDFVISELNEPKPNLNESFDYEMYHLNREDIDEYVEKAIYEKLLGEEMLELEEMDIERKGEEIAYKVLNASEHAREFQLKIEAFQNSSKFAS